jgi:hypothetical protein
VTETIIIRTSTRGDVTQLWRWAKRGFVWAARKSCLKRSCTTWLVRFDAWSRTSELTSVKRTRVARCP